MRQHARGEVADSILLAREGPGEPEDQGQLDQLAGLELERAHREPPPRSARRAAQAGHVHQRQEDEREKEEGDGQFLQTPVADPQREEERQKAQRGACELALEEPEPVPQPRSCVHGGGAVDHHHAQHGEQEDRAQEYRVVVRRARRIAGVGHPDGGRCAHESPLTSALN